jgi:hypothetical protein
MRGLILALAAVLTLAASVQAAPLAPNSASIELGAAPSVELVGEGCGRGWHRARWRDQWGNWQWSDCVPNEGGYGYDGRGAGGTSPIQIGALPRWGW